MTAATPTGDRADYARRLHAAIELVWRLGQGQGEKFALSDADQTLFRAHMMEALKVSQAAKPVDSPPERAARLVVDDVRLRGLIDHLRGVDRAGEA